MGFCTVLPSPYLLSWDIFGPGEICSQPPHSGDYVFKKGRVRATRISFRQPSEGKSGLSLGRKKKGLALVLPPFLSLLTLYPKIVFTKPSRPQGSPVSPLSGPSDAPDPESFSNFELESNFQILEPRSAPQPADYGDLPILSFGWVEIKSGAF